MAARAQPAAPDGANMGAARPEVRQSLPAVKVPDKHQEFAHETAQAWQPGRGQHDDQEARAKHRHARPQSAEVGQLPRVAAVVENPNCQEQAACGDPVRQHLVDAALDSRSR